MIDKADGAFQYPVPPSELEKKGGSLLMGRTGNKIRRTCCAPTFRGLCCLSACLMLILPCCGQKQPTLEETTDWIVSRIKEGEANYSYQYYHGSDIDHASVVVTASFEGCKMKFSVETDFDTPTRNYRIEGSAQLKLLAPPATQTAPFEFAGKYSGPKELTSLTLRSQSAKASAFEAERVIRNG